MVAWFSQISWYIKCDCCWAPGSSLRFDASMEVWVAQDSVWTGLSGCRGASHPCIALVLSILGKYCPFFCGLYWSSVEVQTLPITMLESENLVWEKIYLWNFEMCLKEKEYMILIYFVVIFVSSFYFFLIMFHNKK